MIPIKLRIEGFLSYRKPVELDFTSFDLACISGHNGAGKSALLDAITWALFGQARKRDESIINNHASVKAAEVTLDFEYESNRYRVMRTNPRGKTSMVEFFIQSKAPGTENRWKPLTEHTLTETNQRIIDTLKMDFETFTNASFFLQGKADQFATARPSERKRILSNILELGIWETYRDAASQHRREVEKEIKALDGRLAEIQAELDEGPERKKQLEELQSRLATLTAQKMTQAKNLENVQRLHASLEKERQLIETQKDQLDRLQREVDHILTTLDARQEEKSGYDTILANADAIEKSYQDWQQARADLEAMEEVASTYRQHEALRHEPLRIIEAEKARLQREKELLTKQKTELERSLTQVEALKAKLQSTQTSIQEAKDQLAQREKLDKEIRALQVKQADAKAENPRLKTEMEDLRARLDQLEAADTPECPVCGKPLSEDERTILIRDYYKEGEDRRDRYLKNKDLLDNFDTHLQQLGAAFADLKGTDAKLREATRQADQLKHQIETLERQNQVWEEKEAPRLQGIETALDQGQFALEAQQKLEAIKAEMEALGYDMAAHEKLRQTEQKGREAEVALRKLGNARSALTPIEREIADLQEQQVRKEKDLANLINAYDEAAVKLAASEADLPDLKQAGSDLYDIQEQVNIHLRKVGNAEGRVRSLVQQEQRKADLLAEREERTRRIADLKQLERAFSKDGIPALLIEQALPDLEETANELLTRLTNGRMTLQFETQREYKDTSREDQKETLDLIISDNLGARDYEMFSGGEAFRINFSIRLALSKVLARRAGARLQTLVIDEGFGSQDAQGRQRLVESINLVQDDFEKILVITHLEELKEAFPTRIEVEKTAEGSQLRIL